VEIRTLIKELGRAKTVVLSTHILSEVQATCDRVLIINDGIIVANGTPEQLQRTFQGAEEIGLELKTSSIRPIEEIIPKLKLVAYVNDVALLSHTGDVSKFEIHAEKGNDVRESLFRMASRRDGLFWKCSAASQVLKKCSTPLRRHNTPMATFSLSNVGPIYRREIRSYFQSPVAYVVIVVSSQSSVVLHQRPLSDQCRLSADRL